MQEGADERSGILKNNRIFKLFKKMKEEKQKEEEAVQEEINKNLFIETLRRARKPSVLEWIQQNKLEYALSELTHLRENPPSTSKGFMINFGEWRPVSPRTVVGELWPYDRSLAFGVERASSMTSWFQEYFWDESERNYLARGFWTPVSI
ncbi:uncharacterized protein LOC127281490 [Leptopilina boulardi]|uniref:uncharacterized protein LOC127281490 n=1 Tax=Leptopilina boulardi TaxID=63433 RepID=UPI0021F5CCA6|nr:uncharacterized protein LOC127281490 [Leptopilina boulardi]